MFRLGVLDMLPICEKCVNVSNFLLKNLFIMNVNVNQEITK